jgi:hypothetical protein
MATVVIGLDEEAEEVSWCSEKVPSCPLYTVLTRQGKSKKTGRMNE